MFKAVFEQIYFDKYAEAVRSVLYDGEHTPVVRISSDGFMVEQPYWFHNREHNIDDNFIINVSCTSDNQIRVKVNGRPVVSQYTLYEEMTPEEFKRFFDKAMLEVYDFIIENYGE